MPFHTVHAKFNGKPHRAGKFSNVCFEKRQLKRDSAIIATVGGRIGISDSDKLSYIFEHDLPTATEHDGLVSVLCRPVPRDFDIRCHGYDFLRPFACAMTGKGAVGGEIEPNTVSCTEGENVLELIIEQGFAHCRRNDFFESMRYGVCYNSFNYLEGHKSLRSAFASSLVLKRTVRRVFLAHDTAQIAGIRVRVESNPPRSLSRNNVCGVSSTNHIGIK